jgi:hypothetical protein
MAVKSEKSNFAQNGDMKAFTSLVVCYDIPKLGYPKNNYRGFLKLYLHGKKNCLQSGCNNLGPMCVDFITIYFY